MLIKRLKEKIAKDDVIYTPLTIISLGVLLATIVIGYFLQKSKTGLDQYYFSFYCLIFLSVISIILLLSLKFKKEAYKSDIVITRCLFIAVTSFWLYLSYWYATDLPHTSNPSDVILKNYKIELRTGTKRYKRYLVGETFTNGETFEIFVSKQNIKMIQKYYNDPIKVLYLPNTRIIVDISLYTPNAKR